MEKFLQTAFFNDWNDYESKFIAWCDLYYLPINIRSSKLFNEKLEPDLFARFKYKYAYYKCHHSGENRSHQIDQSRPNQNTDCLQCPFNFSIHHNKKTNTIIIGKIIRSDHNHQLNEAIYKSYSFVRNRLFHENEEANLLTTNLMKAKASTFETRKLIQKRFNAYLTNKDLYNFKSKILQSNLKSQNEELCNWIDDFLASNNRNTAHLKVNSDQILDGIYIQSAYMKEWFQKYPEIIHIDSTFKINVENFQLFICLAQNANLHGVPVAYCFMRASTAENLDFFYSNLSKLNDLHETKAVIVDKDWNNIDRLTIYFTTARILLCTFHVLKYLKSYIDKLVMQPNVKQQLMNLVRKIVYVSNDADMSLHVRQLQFDYPQFYDYFQVNWLNCTEMWQIMHRKDFLNFGTNTNNHIERYNRSIKAHVNSTMHLSEVISNLLKFNDSLYVDEKQAGNNLKRKIFYSHESVFFLKFGCLFVDKAIKLMREQEMITNTTTYVIEEVDEYKRLVYSIKANHVNTVLNNALFNCDCMFFKQHKLPCRHILLVYSSLDLNDKCAKANVNTIFEIAPRWLCDFNAGFVPKYEMDKEPIITDSVAQKCETILASNQKYILIKPLCDQFIARVTQTGTDEFRTHLAFFQYLLDAITSNNFKQLYKSSGCSSFVTISDHSTASSPELSPTKIGHSIQKCQGISNVADVAKPPSFIISKNLNPIGRPRGSKSLVSYSAKKIQNKTKRNRRNKFLMKNTIQRCKAGKFGKPVLLHSKAVTKARTKCCRNLLPEGTEVYNKVAQDVSETLEKSNIDFSKQSLISNIHTAVDGKEWLTNLHINIFLKLLETDFPEIEGLCDSQLFMYKEYKPRSNYIIIFNPGMHWVTLSNIGCAENTWGLYNSMCNICNMDPYIQFFKQLFPDLDAVFIDKRCVQQQSNSNDCGIFALAFATSLCYQKDPGTVLYVEDRLRSHYNSCISNNKAVEFPSNEMRVRNYFRRRAKLQYLNLRKLIP